MDNGVGDFFVDTSALGGEDLKKAFEVLDRIEGEVKIDYPEDKFNRREDLGYEVISFKDFLPHWIKLQRNRLKKAEDLAKELGITVHE